MLHAQPQNVQCLWPKCQVQNLFSKFRSGDMSLRDQLRSRRSSDLDQKALKELIECNPLKSTQ